MNNTFRFPHTIFFLIAAIFWGPQLTAQSPYPVRIITDARDGEIRLRWAPLNFETWELGNQNGYRLERQSGNGNIEVLADNLRPLPLADWEPIADTLEAALLYAGALYSESFQNLPQSNDIQTTEDLNSVPQNRYSLSLFVADQFFTISQAAGLGYIDQNVMSGQNYVYRISVNNFTPPAGSNNGSFTATNADDRTVLPPPADPMAEWANVKVKIGWDQSKTNTNYTSYQLERSASGGPFETVNPFPIVFIETEENKDPNVYFVDSLAANDIEYTYRVRGRSPFGVLGPPSKTVKGAGKPLPLAYTARIVDMIQTPENGLRLNWELAPEAEGRVKNFEIYRSRDGRDDYERVSRRKLSPDTRTFVDTDPRSGWFYTVILTDDNGYELSGPTALLVLKDDDPPAPPIGLEGSMDSLGNVTITWMPNTEPDHQGYRVFMSNQRESRFIQLTKDAITRRSFNYKVTMETTTEVVYFAVKAIDYYGNYSLLSSPLEVERPDLIPPVAAVFKSLEGSTEGVTLTWAPSPSKDIVSYTLQRKINTEEDRAYVSVFTTQDNTLSYFDSDLQRGQTYTYRLVVTDDAGWESPGRAASAGRIDDGKRAEITNFSAVSEDNRFVQLTFSCNYPIDPAFFQIFRSKNGEPQKTLRTLNLDDPALKSAGRQQYRFQDDDLRKGDTVSYRILARFEDGGFTPLTKAISLTIE